MTNRNVCIVALFLAAASAQSSLSEAEKEQVIKACNDGKAQIEEQIASASLDDASCTTVATTLADDQASQDQFSQVCPEINLKTSFGSADTCDKFLAAYTETCNKMVNCAGGGGGIDAGAAAGAAGDSVGLSLGAIIGIAVGASVLNFLIICGVRWWCKKQKKKAAVSGA